MPFSPQIEYRGDQYLFQGLAGAGASIGGGLQGIFDRMEKQKEEDKNRAREFKAYQELLDISGIAGKDKTTTMDLDSLRGLAQGAALKQQMQQHQLQMQQMQAQQEQQAALAGFGRDYASGDVGAAELAGQAPPLPGVGMRPSLPDYSGAGTASAPNFMLAPPPGASAGAMRQTPDMRAMFALGRNPGAIVAPQFDNSLNSLARIAAMGAGPESVNFTEDPISHNRFATFGKTLSKSGVNPIVAGTPLLAKPVMANGNHTGYMVGGRYIPKDEFEGLPANAQLEPVKDTEGKPIAGMYRDKKTGKIVKSQVSLADSLAAILGGAGAGGTGAPAAAVNPNDPLGLGLGK